MGAANDERDRVIAEVLVAAREVQEFIWGELSLSHDSYDPEKWCRVFQKRVNSIGEVDMTSPSGVVELRKRLLQQAALSIAAIEVLDRF